MRNMIIAAASLCLAACGGSAVEPQPTANESAMDPAATPATATPVEDARATTPLPGGAQGATSTPTATRWQNEVRATTQGGYLMGNPDARIKLVEYGSRTCPSCARFAKEAMRPLAERYVSTGRVSYEFRDFIIHGGADIAASVVGRCGRPSAFFPVLEATYAEQDSALKRLQSATPDEQKRLEAMPITKAMAWIAERGGYVAVAERNGVPARQTARCLADEKIAQALVDRTNAAKEVKGTPAFSINGRMIEAHDWKAVEAELRKAGA